MKALQDRIDVVFSRQVFAHSSCVAILIMSESKRPSSDEALPRGKQEPADIYPLRILRLDPIRIGPIREIKGKVNSLSDIL